METKIRNHWFDRSFTTHSAPQRHLTGVFVNSNKISEYFFSDNHSLIISLASETFFPANCSVFCFYKTPQKSFRYTNSLHPFSLLLDSFIFLYTVLGFTQRFVTPNNVSGRSVAVGMI